jgi:TolB protein
MKLWLLLLAFLGLQNVLFAEDGLTIVAVGEAEVEKDKMVFVPAQVPGNASASQKKSINEMQSLFQNDFSFYKQYFDVMSPEGYSKAGIDKDFSALKSKNLRYLILSHYELATGGQISIEGTLYDISTSEKLAVVKDTFSDNNLREKGHGLTHQLYGKIKNSESIFKSKIIFVSDRNSSRSTQVKELYMMDFDGRNPVQLTSHHGTVISPAFSFDGKKVLYSLIKNTRNRNRNVNLYVMDLDTKKSQIVSSKKGINSGAVFMPDGEHIALTMSHQGNAEIYALNIKSGATRRITKHFAPDVDPSFNQDGSKMVFLSGRSGSSKPMIYIADPRDLEKDVKRRGFVGDYNATPRFAPNGRELAFSSWMDGKFDIFRIDEDGRNLYRLTKDFGSNEDPTYSNDGQFIAFSSQRVLSQTKAVQNIYIMTRDGEILGQVTENFGNCSTPRWSKY